MALPSYLKSFKIEEKDDVKHVFKCLKKGTYDIKKEERMLTKLRQSIGQRGDTADKIFEKLGIVGLQRKLDRIELMEK